MDRWVQGIANISLEELAQKINDELAPTLRPLQSV